MKTIKFLIILTIVIINNTFTTAQATTCNITSERKGQYIDTPPGVKQLIINEIGINKFMNHDFNFKETGFTSCPGVMGTSICKPNSYKVNGPSTHYLYSGLYHLNVDNEYMSMTISKPLDELYEYGSVASAIEKQLKTSPDPSVISKAKKSVPSNLSHNFGNFLFKLNDKFYELKITILHTRNDYESNKFNYKTTVLYEFYDKTMWLQKQEKCEISAAKRKQEEQKIEDRVREKSKTLVIK